jgi:hypothetical protein
MGENMPANGQRWAIRKYQQGMTGSMPWTSAAPGRLMVGRRRERNMTKWCATMTLDQQAPATLRTTGTVHVNIFQAGA